MSNFFRKKPYHDRKFISSLGEDKPNIEQCKIDLYRCRNAFFIDGISLSNICHSNQSSEYDDWNINDLWDYFLTNMFIKHGILLTQEETEKSKVFFSNFYNGSLLNIGGACIVEKSNQSKKYGIYSDGFSTRFDIITEPERSCLVINVEIKKINVNVMNEEDDPEKCIIEKKDGSLSKGIFTFRLSLFNIEKGIYLPQLGIEDVLFKHRNEVVSCLVPGCNDVYYNELASKEALWDKYFTGAPERQRRCVERYKIVKRA